MSVQREPDGVAEGVEAAVRSAVRAAGATAERFARGREQALRRQLDERQRAELLARVDQDHRTDRNQMALADHPQFWERATPQEIGRTYGAARAWADRDLEAQRIAGQLGGQLRTRYGIDPEAEVQRGLARSELVESQRAEAEAVGAERRAVQAEQESAPTGRTDAVVDGGTRDRSGVDAASWSEPGGTATSDPDTIGPQAWVSAREDGASGPGTGTGPVGAEVAGRDEDPVAAGRAESERDHGREARADGARSYDSAERRAATAAGLEARGIAPQTVATRMRADVSQARPATEATRTPGRARTATARASRVRGVRRQQPGPER